MTCLKDECIFMLSYLNRFNEMIADQKETSTKQNMQDIIQAETAKDIKAIFIILHEIKEKVELQAGQSGKKWDSASKYVLFAILGGVIAFVLKTVGVL